MFIFVYQRKVNKKYNINAIILFSDDLFTKYTFLEKLLCKDFVFIPENTKAVSTNDFFYTYWLLFLTIENWRLDQV